MIIRLLISKLNIKTCFITCSHVHLCKQKKISHTVAQWSEIQKSWPKFEFLKFSTGILHMPISNLEGLGHMLRLKK